MKRITTLGTAFLATFALGALIATTALAAEAEWLVEGKTLAQAVNSEIEGQIQLTDYNGEGKLTEPLNKILCSLIFTTAIGPGGDQEFLSVLNLAKEAIGKDELKGTENTLSGNPLLCNVTFDAGSLEDCKEGENVAEVWFANLPWNDELILLGTPGSFGLSSKAGPPEVKTPGWEVECTALIGIKGQDLCEGFPSYLAQNNLESTPPSALITFNELEAVNLANCSFTGVHTGELISDGGESSDQWAIGSELERLTTAVSNES